VRTKAGASGNVASRIRGEIGRRRHTLMICAGGNSSSAFPRALARLDPLVDLVPVFNFAEAPHILSFRIRLQPGISRSS